MYRKICYENPRCGKVDLRTAVPLALIANADPNHAGKRWIHWPALVLQFAMNAPRYDAKLERAYEEPRPLQLIGRGFGGY